MPTFKPVKMMCDELIDEKLEKYEPVKTCFANPATTLMLGKQGVGKTTTMINLMKNVFKKCFHNVILVMPENSINSIPEKDNIFYKYLGEDDIFHDYTPEILESIYDRLQASSDNGEYTILIVDDFGSKLKSPQTEEILNRIIVRQRHLKVLTFLLLQNYFQLSKRIREVCQNIFMFNIGKSQASKVLAEQLELKPEEFNDFMSLYKKPNDFVLISLKHKRYFYNMKDEIVFSQEDISNAEEK
jgi:hypothetical protein